MSHTPTRRFRATMGSVAIVTATAALITGCANTPDYGAICVNKHTGQYGAGAVRCDVAGVRAVGRVRVAAVG